MDTFCEYFKKDNLLLCIDSRIKLTVALFTLILVLSYQGFLFHLAVVLLCLFCCLKMRIPLKIFALRFSEPVFIAAIVISLKFITAHQAGLMSGLLIAARILSAVSIVAVLGFSTPFNEFIGALGWLRVPRGFIEVLAFAYRYIFILLEDALVIYNAQKNRLGYTGIRRSLGSFGYLSGSLILKSFEKSHNLTVAMLQRGYDGNIPKQKQNPFLMRQVLAGGLTIIIMTFLWCKI